MRILVINGPNLNLLGKREPQLYGSMTLDDIEKMLTKSFPDVKFEFFQSNIEGVLVEYVQKAMSGAFDGVLLNAGAYTHTSYALRDAVAMLKVPVIEVHLTNIHAREEFRHRSVIAPVCRGLVAGFGAQSYLLAAKALIDSTP
ncbi:MAG TPA: type II 3-dehydroquinate dehydratase [Bacteroidota bacterium]|nr:type II 3-dehydroquinate dehydratase [Bacteroidota bacterium]